MYQLRSEQPQIADFADTAAERVEQLSTYLREHDAREIVDRAEQFARRQPALVVGGGLLAGLLVGRMLRSGSSAGSGQQFGQTGSPGNTGWSGGGNGWTGEFGGTPTAGDCVTAPVTAVLAKGQIVFS